MLSRVATQGVGREGEPGVCETSRGEGWWLASDQRWYPPEAAEDARPTDSSSAPEPVPELDGTPPVGGTAASPSDRDSASSPSDQDTASSPSDQDAEPPAEERAGPARRRRKLAAAAALVVVLAAGGTALALQGSGPPVSRATFADRVGSDRTAAPSHRPTATARLPYSAATAPAPTGSTHGTSRGAAPAPHRTMDTEPHATTSATSPCCTVPNVVNVQFAQAQEDVYSARLNPQETSGTPADCAGRTIPKGTFIIERQDPVPGSVLMPGATVTLYFCAGSTAPSSPSS
jgi:hypothetical protein